MARLKIPDEDRILIGKSEIRELLAGCGIEYQKWSPNPPTAPGASDAEVLEAYADKIEEFNQRGGYVTADVITVSPETPGLDEMMSKFAREHIHAEDEVRFIVEGHGLFHIHPDNGPVLAIEIEAGDLISVPAGTLHWFVLCSDRQVRAVRLFQNPEGWTPKYTESGIDARYEPVCFGPEFIPQGPSTL
jgi:1,2-dihydroxy-3-keto-5-methylthiopentene dioxygenase